MPRGDRTGPMGEGPMSGKAQGLCAASSKQDQADYIPGFGWHGGRGRGRGPGSGGGRCRGQGFGGFGGGHGRRFHGDVAVPAEADPDQAMALLQERAEYLRQAQEEVSRRISELETAHKER